MALIKLFDYRCSPSSTVIKARGPQLQSMCDDTACPLDPMSQCGLEENNGNVLISKNVTMMPSASAPDVHNRLNIFITNKHLGHAVSRS